MLHAEGTHAAWQWIEQKRPGTKLPTLNAVLKLQTYLANFNGQFPESLCRHMDTVCNANYQKGKRMQDEGVEGPMMLDNRYEKRFNLSPLDVDLLKTHLEDKKKKDASDGSAETAWANYARWVFRPGLV